eukprot:TRINITY_DN17239_c0_g1_i1.p2 TRINITY_DN17239_c0_g1~~TRINITY_DN17239_c0_g1_i1.p2  ORF type:complete len:130 (+),score=32.48 TRINITY_DN17239_c0_g1_i1:135-524(+)
MVVDALLSMFSASVILLFIISKNLQESREGRREVTKKALCSMAASGLASIAHLLQFSQQFTSDGTPYLDACTITGSRPYPSLPLLQDKPSTTFTPACLFTVILAVLSLKVSSLPTFPPNMEPSPSFSNH